MCMARTWLGVKSVCFFWPEKSGFQSENPFFRMGPRFLTKGQTLGVGSVLAPI